MPQQKTDNALKMSDIVPTGMIPERRDAVFLQDAWYDTKYRSYCAMLRKALCEVEQRCRQEFCETDNVVEVADIDSIAAMPRTMVHTSIVVTMDNGAKIQRDLFTCVEYVEKGTRESPSNQQEVEDV